MCSWRNYNVGASVSGARLSRLADEGFWDLWVSEMQFMRDTSSLDEIGVRLGTDKASTYHDYLAAYEAILHPLRSSPIRLLEIGVLDGASLAMWEEYFPHATVVGADINPAASRFARGRIAIEILDQSNVDRLDEVAERHGPFDVIIEDGSHIWSHQIIGIVALFPRLQPGGFYITEDLHTNYGHLARSYRRDARVSCMDFLKSTADMLVGDGDEVQPIDPAIANLVSALHSITFIHRACILTKKRYVSPISGSAGEPLIVRPSIQTLPVRLLLHLSEKGDVSGLDGYVNLIGDAHQVEGLAIDAGDISLEARVRWPDGTWSVWSEARTFVGSRGVARGLTGVSVRLATRAANDLSLHVYGRFAGQKRLVEAGNGAECFSPIGGVLCGLQVILHKP